LLQTYLLGAPVVLAHVLAGLEVLNDLLDSGLLHKEVLHLKRLATTAGLLLVVLERLLSELDVLDAQLVADDLQVTDGVDVTLNVNDLSIVEATHDLEDGIDGANVGQERVSETSTSRSTTGQTSNVVDGKVGRDAGLGLVLLAKPVEALIGHDDTRLLGVDGSVGEVGRVTECALGNGLEQRRFTYVGETDLRNVS
jgi:hypothetical protein